MNNKDVFKSIAKQLHAHLKSYNFDSHGKVTAQVGSYKVTCNNTPLAIRSTLDKFEKPKIHRCVAKIGARVASREPMARLAKRYPECADQFNMLGAS